MNKYENYYEWLDAVDNILLERTMISSDDLMEDYSFPAAYDDGRSPVYAAIESLFDIDLEDVR